MTCKRTQRTTFLPPERRPRRRSPVEDRIYRQRQKAGEVVWRILTPISASPLTVRLTLGGVNCVMSVSAQRRPADISSTGRVFSQVPIPDIRGSPSRPVNVHETQP